MTLSFAHGKFLAGLVVLACGSSLVPAQAPAGGDKPAATVNGEAIALNEVKAILEQRPSPVPLTEAQQAEMRKAALNMLIDDALMRQFLRKHAPPANPAEVGKAFRAKFGVDVLDGVGSTEMLHQYVCNSPGDVKYGTSGKPVPGYEVRLVDEHGKEVADGEVGEMLVKGPSAAEGYWNQREKSLATFEGGWTRSGPSTSGRTASTSRRGWRRTRRPCSC